MRLILALAVSASFAPIGAAAEIYRCVEKGKTTYTEEPCGGEAKAGTVPLTPPPRPPAEKSAALQEAANLGRVQVGMSKSQVELAWAKPQFVRTTTDGTGRLDQWTYKGRDAETHVYFRNGTVASITRFAYPAKVPSAARAPVPPTTTDLDAAERAAKATERRLVREGETTAIVEANLGKPERTGWAGGRAWWAYLPAAKDPQARTIVWFRYGRVVAVERKIER